MTTISLEAGTCHILNEKIKHMPTSKAQNICYRLLSKNSGHLHFQEVSKCRTNIHRGQFPKALSMIFQGCQKDCPTALEQLVQDVQNIS